MEEEIKNIETTTTEADKIKAETLAEDKSNEEQKKAIEAIKKFANEEDNDEEDDDDVPFSLKTIFGGDILASKFMQHQVVFIMFLTILAILYTGNRYASQQEALLIDSLKVELQEENYKVLTIESQLLNATRQSEIVKKLQANGDSLMLQPLTPPFELNKKEEDD